MKKILKIKAEITETEKEYSRAIEKIHKATSWLFLKKKQQHKKTVKPRASVIKKKRRKEKEWTNKHFQ